MLRSIMGISSIAAGSPLIAFISSPRSFPAALALVILSLPLLTFSPFQQSIFYSSLLLIYLFVLNNPALIFNFFLRSFNLPFHLTLIFFF